MTKKLDLAALKTDLKLVSRDESVYLEWWEVDALIEAAEEKERLRGALSEIAALYQPSMQSPTSADASRSRILILRAREIAYAALDAL